MINRFSLMETFVAVVESGSFSAAAKRLNVGQPAISKAIAALEAHLGTRLLLRSTRGQTATEGGLAFYEGAVRAIEQAQAAEKAARMSANEVSGTIRISAAVTFSRLHIIPRLAAFLASYPQLSVDLIMDDGHIDLVEHGIDVALRMGRLHDSSMTARKIASQPRSVMATPAYFAQHGLPQDPAELKQHQCIVYSGSAATYDNWVFTRDNQAQSVKISGRLKVSAAEGVRAAILADMELCIVSEWMFSPELADGSVCKILSDWQLPPIDLWALFPGGRLVSAKSRAFVSFVEEIIQ